jgi:hypothetical protein
MTQNEAAAGGGTPVSLWQPAPRDAAAAIHEVAGSPAPDRLLVVRLWAVEAQHHGAGECAEQPLLGLGPVWHGSRAKLQGGAGQSMPNTLTPEL